MLNVQGQNRALALLQRAMAAGRLGHTWIFAGPYGVGKYKLAIELARTAMCDHPRRQGNGQTLPQLVPDFSLTLPCGVCESCAAIEAGTHPDLHLITKELIRYHDKSGKSKGTTLGIDVIRGEITGDTEAGKEPKIYKRSFRGRGKWFIIDEADLMEAPAQNALLKTLEEPPAESYLVMITTSPQELLSTIRSRAQVVEFGALPDEVLLAQLIGRGLSHEDAGILARLAHGSLGHALRWAQDMGTITEKNAAAAQRAAKRAAAKGGDEEEGGETVKFTPGGLVAWARMIAAALDGLAGGQGGAGEVAAAIHQSANEYADLQLVRDPLMSRDQALRNGVALMLGIAADWFADRLRQGLGSEHAVRLPARTAGLDPTVVRAALAAARQAEGQVDMNAHVALVLATTTTQWEKLLHV